MEGAGAASLLPDPPSPPPPTERALPTLQSVKGAGAASLLPPSPPPTERALPTLQSLLTVRRPDGNLCGVYGNEGVAYANECWALCEGGAARGAGSAQSDNSLGRGWEPRWGEWLVGGHRSDS